MTDRIIFLDGSKKLSKKIVIEGMRDIDKIRPLEVDYVKCPEIINTIAQKVYNPKRNQIDATGFLQHIMNTKFAEYVNQGKIILLDYDIYDATDPNSNWFFGGFSGTNRGLGYITLSTARLQDEIHARDLVRHEIGHMFNAPKEGRTNTYENLGLHCKNRLCVMQQKDTVPDSIKYTHKRARKKAQTYCTQCAKDIKDYIPN